MLWRLLALLIVLHLASGDAWAAKPRQSPPIYNSANKGLTFHTPPRSFYCPLPDDWIWSDHGTTVFLARPVSCGGTGFTSSGRTYSLETTPRISIYYGYWLEDFPPEPPCKVVAKAQFLGKLQSVCRVRREKMKAVEVYSRYQADNVPAEVYITLVTTPARYEADMKVFRALLLSVKRCKPSGCPAKGEFF